MKQFGKTRDMTQGSIVRQVILYSLPLMLGNIFQMLYNTVDVIVVGNYVSKQALAAVGSTTVIINMLVFFFNGFSLGAGVVIARHFGARDMERLHTAIETTMAATFALCAVFTVVGVAGVRPMLRLMATPEDVMDDATTYLTIYFMGISGLLVYNMGSGILRAVGDTTHPLLFLIMTSLLNIALDLAFVLGLNAGIAGVAWATVLSQLISSALILRLLSRTKDIYRVTWRDLRIDRGVLSQIFAVGLPAGIQAIITSFSNIFVQAYVNAFGSAVMAGWSSYNKLDQFVLMLIQSMAMAATTFVSQNIGAGQEKRADRGTVATLLTAEIITLAIAVPMVVFARFSVGLFTPEPDVIDYGSMFLRANTFFLMANCVNHVLAGALRGRGDSRGPMIIMLTGFVAIRQAYLFIVTRFIANTPLLVGLGYPVGWTSVCIIEIIYFFRRWKKRAAPKTAESL